MLEIWKNQTNRLQSLYFAIFYFVGSILIMVENGALKIISC